MCTTRVFDSHRLSCLHWCLAVVNPTALVQPNNMSYACKAKLLILAADLLVGPVFAIQPKKTICSWRFVKFWMNKRKVSIFCLFIKYCVHSQYLRLYSKSVPALGIISKSPNISPSLVYGSTKKNYYPKSTMRKVVWLLIGSKSGHLIINPNPMSQ